MKLIEYLPDFMQNIVDFKELFNTEDKEVEKLLIAINNIATEPIVKIAQDYGLERYEKIYNITNVAETLEARRMAILFKMNNRTAYTLQWLINTLNEAFGKENYKLTTDLKNYLLNIEIALNYTEAAQVLKESIANQIPANMVLDYRLFTFINIKTAVAITHQQEHTEIPAKIGEKEEKIELNAYSNIAVTISINDKISI